MPNNTGWVCPRCNTVYAPNIETCHKCKPITQVHDYYNNCACKTAGGICNCILNKIIVT